MKKVYDIKVQSVNNKNDFLSAFYSTFQMTEGSDDNVAPGQYYFNDTTGVLSVNSPGSKSLYYRLYFSNLSRGDIIELEFEGMNVSSDTGIQVQIQETNGKGQPSVAIPYTLFVHRDKDSTWKKESVSFVNQIQSTNNIYVCVGLFASDSGHIKLRNVKARVKSSTGIGASKKVEVIKKGEIIKNSSGWSRRTDFVGENVTLSTVDANTLRVTYETPFTGSRPIVIVNQEWYSSSYKYVARVSNSFVDYFELKFTDNTGAIVPLANLSNDVFIGFVAIGEKSYFE